MKPPPAILVAHDEPDHAAALTASLERHNFRIVATADDAKTAIETALRTRPDLIVISMQLRGSQDGIDAAACINGHFAVPVVFVSDHGDEATLRRAQGLHAYAFLIGPIDDGTLAANVQMALSRFHADAEARRSQAHTRAILEMARDGIFVADLTGRITQWNSAAQQLFGYTKHQALEAYVQNLFEPCVQLENVEPECHSELEAITSTGQKIPVELSWSRWAHDEGIFFTGIVRDARPRKKVIDILAKELESRSRSLEDLAREVTERKHQLQVALDSMAVAREHAEHASQLKSTFLSMVSHELRTPLAGLALQVERLKIEVAATGNTSLATLAKRMANSTKRLQDMVEGVLHYTRIESEGLSTKVEDFDILGLCRDTLDELQPQVEFKGLSLRFEPASKIPPIFTSDARLLRLIIINLVSNAIKFTDAGAITVSLVYNEPSYVLSVTDTGRGIPSEQHHRIFEPFEQGTDIKRKSIEGVGLGLALVREMVTCLGGRISVVSEVGVGSTFFVTLSSLCKTSAQARVVKGARAGQP